MLQNESPPKKIQAIEIQENYLKIAKKRTENFPNTPLFIQNQKIFDLNFQKYLNWQTSGSLLVIGNPPWVTNSQLGIEGSNNLPKKTNLKNLSALEAIIGSANFDISEYIWLKLIKETDYCLFPIAYHQPNRLTPNRIGINCFKSDR